MLRRPAALGGRRAEVLAALIPAERLGFPAIFATVCGGK
jgi:hypothetical protein